MNKEHIYLDNVSTTNVSAEVLNAMLPVLTNNYGNASSMHSFGRVAEKLVAESRETIAETINAKAKEIYFTSSGSEANSWAIVGIANGNRNKGNHIIVSAIEHSSILEACKYLEKEGFEVTYLPVDKSGFINFTEFLRAIKSNTVLVSIASANSEIGTIQNIKAISQTAHEKGIIFHTDVVPLYGNMFLDVEELGIDAMTISSHKIYGPKGVGALYVSSKVKIDPIIFGGNEENGKRGGTHNTAGIVGFAKACEVAIRDMRTNSHKVRALSEYFITKLTDTVENIKFNVNTRQKLPHIISVEFVGVDGESLLTKLDLNGVTVSTGSDGLTNLPVSQVLSAIGLNNDRARCSVRFSLGKNNSYEELDKAVAIIARSVEELRAFSSTYGMKIRKRKGDKNDK
ncbi:MAG: cysteine desulfurase [Clostridia bacterium]|nr:cysteine desulfurase [Clostridia bacterium]